jgi:hypothetical protein
LKSRIARLATLHPRKRDETMEPCDQPLADMAFCEAVNCVWRKSVDALGSVFSAPGAASISDWALAILAALLALGILAFLMRALAPRSRVREHAPSS